jgi:hypothetical protein
MLFKIGCPFLNMNKKSPGWKLDPWIISQSIVTPVIILFMKKCAICASKDAKAREIVKVLPQKPGQLQEVVHRWMCDRCYAIWLQSSHLA